MSMSIHVSPSASVGQINQIGFRPHVGVQRQDKTMRFSPESTGVAGVRLGLLQGRQGHAVQHVGILVERNVDNDVASLFIGINRVEEEEGLGGVDDFGGLSGRAIYDVEDSVTISVPSHSINHCSAGAQYA